MSRAVPIGRGSAVWPTAARGRYGRTGPRPPPWSSKSPPSAASVAPSGRSRPGPVSPAIGSRVLKRLKLNRLNALEPAPPVQRYERTPKAGRTPPSSAGLIRRPPHHQRSQRPEQRPWRRLGVRPCRHRRLARRLRSDPPGSASGQRQRLPEGGPRLLCQPRHSHRARHTDNDLLPGQGLPSSLPACRPQTHPQQGLQPQDQRQGRIQTAIREWACNSACADANSSQRALHLRPCSIATTGTGLMLPCKANRPSAASA